MFLLITDYCICRWYNFTGWRLFTCFDLCVSIVLILISAHWLDFGRMHTVQQVCLTHLGGTSLQCVLTEVEACKTYDTTHMHFTAVQIAYNHHFRLLTLQVFGSSKETEIVTVFRRLFNHFVLTSNLWEQSETNMTVFNSWPETAICTFTIRLFF